MEFIALAKAAFEMYKEHGSTAIPAIAWDKTAFLDDDLKSRVFDGSMLRYKTEKKTEEPKAVARPEPKVEPKPAPEPEKKGLFGSLFGKKK